MIGILVVTHSNFAKGLRDSVEMITGPQENFEVLGFYEGEDMMVLSESIKEVTDRFKLNNDKFVILVDLFGASPFNASAIAIANEDASIITGVNLPLLLELVIQRNLADDYDQFLETSLANAVESMKVVKMSEMFKE